MNKENRYQMQESLEIVSNKFKLPSGTKFCAKSKVQMNLFPLVLEKELELDQCTGLKVKFLGTQFIVSQWSECTYKLLFDKGTVYSLDTDVTGLFKSLEYRQEFVLQSGSMIEIPAGTLLVSFDKQIGIEITLAKKLSLEVIH